MSPTLAQILTNPKPITRAQLAEPEYRTLLEDLQGNILTAHGFDRARYFFITFKPDAAAVEGLKYLFAMLARDSKALERAATRGEARGKLDGKLFDALAPVAVGSELDVYARRAAERGPKSKPHSAVAVSRDGVHHPSVNILLSASGYTKLGVEPPPDEAFRAGMVSRRAKLKDPEKFEPDYARAIDALVIVAHADDDKTVVKRLDALQAALEAHAIKLSVEEGRLLRASPAPSDKKEGAPKPPPIEPFGYRDAISQPIFYQDHLTHLADTGRVTSSFNPTAALRLALVPDPCGKTPYSCGSYFVFRKLEQNVSAFYEMTNKLPGGNGEDIRARLIGRRLDGTPLVGSEPGANGFDFSNDKKGSACPFFAHMRKMNPRSDLEPIYDGPAHRIVRRAMSFGPKLERHPNGAPVLPIKEKKPVGLLFLCAQANIANQYEHLQSRWANPASHPRDQVTGVDPIMGQLSPGQENLLNYGGGTAKFDPFVALQGGEYFFAPSLSFLRSLFTE